MAYTEPQLFAALNLMAKIYLESHREDQQALEHFLSWAHAQYGYRYGNS